MLTPAPGARSTREARLVAVTLADQAGAAPDTAGPVRRSSPRVFSGGPWTHG